jgi:hypothetical protein
MVINNFRAALAAAALKVLYAFSMSEKAISVTEFSRTRTRMDRKLTVGDQFACWNAACLKQTQEHGSCDSVDKSRCYAQIHHPQLFDFELAAFTMDTNVGDGTSNSHKVLGHLQCGRNPACFHHCISTRIIRQVHQRFDGIGLVWVDGVMGT